MDRAKETVLSLTNHTPSLLSPRYARLVDDRNNNSSKTFNPVIKIEDRIIDKLLPKGSYRRIGHQLGCNSQVFELWGNWRSLIHQWDMQGRAHLATPLSTSIHCRSNNNHNHNTNTYGQLMSDQTMHGYQKMILIKVRFLVDTQHELHCISEDVCHERLSNIGQHICPALLYSATIEYRDLGTIRISLMEYIPNAFTLGELLNTSSKYHSLLNWDVYNKIQQSILLMWKAGVAHCDLHELNILVQIADDMYDAKNDVTRSINKKEHLVINVFIIDFGHSVLLPEPMKQQLILNLNTGIGDLRSPEDIFEAVLLKFLQDVQRNRRLDYIHLDSLFIRMLKKHIALLHPRLAM